MPVNSESMILGLLDALPVMLFVSRERDGAIVFANARGARRIGLRNDGQAEANHSDDMPGGLGGRMMVRTLDHRGEPQLFQAQITAAIGEQHRLTGLAGTFGVDGEEFRVAAFHDIEQAEPVLQSLQFGYQNEALRRLIAQVAHRLSNALVPVLTFSSMATSGMAPQDMLQSYMERIASGAQECANLVDEMGIYCRDKSRENGATDLTATARCAESALSCILPRQIALDSDFDDVVLPVDVEPQLLQDIIVGLSLAGLDVVIRRPDLVELSTGFAQTDNATPMAEMVIAVSRFRAQQSTGTGAQVQAPKLDSFADELDLSSVQAIVAGLRGSLNVSSVADSLSIRLRLPMHQDLTTA